MTNQSEQLKNLLKYSWEEAERLKHKYVSPEHFLLSMFKLHDCNAMKILRNMNFDVPKAQQYIENNFNITPDNYSSSILLRLLNPPSAALTWKILKRRSVFILNVNCVKE